MVRSALAVFSGEIDRHAEGWCRGTGAGRRAARSAARTAMTGHARLRVDPIACDGRGLCAEILPELIALDDWGFPVICGDDVPERLLEEAREAVRLCPKLALWLETAAG